MVKGVFAQIWVQISVGFLSAPPEVHPVVVTVLMHLAKQHDKMLPHATVAPLELIQVVYGGTEVTVSPAFTFAAQ